MGRRKLIQDEELLARVREIFVREGIGVSSRKIAEEIGISSSVLFQRFRSKEELFFAAMLPPAPDFSTLVAETSREGDTLAELEQVATGLLEYFRKVIPVLLPLATHPAFEYEAFRKRHPNSPLESLIAVLMAAWGEKRDKGEIECPDVGVLVLNLVAVAQSLALFERIGTHDEAFKPSMVRELVRLLWSGIAPVRRRGPAKALRSTNDTGTT